MQDTNNNREDAVDADSETQVVPAQQPAWAPPPASGNAYFDDQRTVYQRMTHEAQTSPEDDADDVFSAPLVPDDDDQATQLVALPRKEPSPEDQYVDITDDQTTQLTPAEWGAPAEGEPRRETYGPPGTALSDLHDEGMSSTMHVNQTFASFPAQEDEHDSQETTMLPPSPPREAYDESQATTIIPPRADTQLEAAEQAGPADDTPTEQPPLAYEPVEADQPTTFIASDDAATTIIPPDYSQQYSEAEQATQMVGPELGSRQDNSVSEDAPHNALEEAAHETTEYMAPKSDKETADGPEYRSEGYFTPAGWGEQPTYMTPPQPEVEPEAEPVEIGPTQTPAEPAEQSPPAQADYPAEPATEYGAEPSQEYRPAAEYVDESDQAQEQQQSYQPDQPYQYEQPPQGVQVDPAQGYPAEAGQGYPPQGQYQGFGDYGYSAGYGQQTPFDPTHGARSQPQDAYQQQESGQDPQQGYPGQTGYQGQQGYQQGYQEQPQYGAPEQQQYVFGEQYNQSNPAQQQQQQTGYGSPQPGAQPPVAASPTEFDHGAQDPGNAGMQGGMQSAAAGQQSSYMVPQNIPGRFVPTAEEFAARRAHKPQTPEATMGLPGLVKRLTFGIFAPPMSKREEEHREYVATVRRNFGGLRQITVVNPKGGAGKTVASLMTAMTFGQNRGGYVLAWDNNETQGTLGMRAQPDFHSHTVRDVLQSLDTFLGPGGKVGDLSSFVRSQGEAMFDVLASDESATAGEMLTASAFKQIREVVSRFYKLIIVDTGNNVRAENWQAAIDQTDQLMVTMSARGDSAETAARMLDHLEQTGRSSLVRHAVTVVSMPPSRRGLDLPAIERHFSARTRSVLIAPYEPMIDSGEPIRYENISNASKEAWLRIASSVAEGL